MFKTKFPILAFPKTLAGVAKALFDLNKQIAIYWGGLASDSPIVNGKHVPTVTLVASVGATKVYHKLGRRPVGALITGSTSDTELKVVMHGATYLTTDEYFWVYNISGDLTYVTFWVF